MDFDNDDDDDQISGDKKKHIQEEIRGRYLLGVDCWNEYIFFNQKNQKFLMMVAIVHRRGRYHRRKKWKKHFESDYHSKTLSKFFLLSSSSNAVDYQ